MRNSLVLLVLFSLTSCALFRGPSEKKSQGIGELLSKVRAEGEGKGRLTYKGKQDVVSIDVALKENNDWLLAVSAPLHGEEAMVLSNLKEERSDFGGEDKFERRLLTMLAAEIGGNEDEAREHIRGMRKMLRLLLASRLGLSTECNELMCKQGDDVYQVALTESQSYGKTLLLKSADGRLHLTAQNLTDSFFLTSTFELFHNGRQILKLELFWN